MPLFQFIWISSGFKLLVQQNKQSEGATYALRNRDGDFSPLSDILLTKQLVGLIKKLK